MPSETGDPATATTYELTCTDCGFEATVEGTFLDALEMADDHQEKRGELPSEHFVNFARSGHG